MYGAPGDGEDNDCDLNVDEELYNSIDDDHDGVVDEVTVTECGDCQLGLTLLCFITTETDKCRF
jgi:hypothetical protein